MHEYGTTDNVKVLVMGLFFLAAAKIWAFAFQKQAIEQFFFAIVDISCLVFPTKYLLTNEISMDTPLSRQI